MKPALFLAFALAATSPAYAQAANTAAEAEARRFLIPCDKVSAGDRGFCTQSQTDFLEDYVHAMAGEPDFIEEMTHFFGTWPTTDPRPWRPGIRSDRQEGCAWMLVQAAFTPSPKARDKLAVQIYQACIDFTAQARLAIWLRATDLVAQIRAHPTTPPPDDDAPLTDAEKRCLDSTVTPLSTGPGTSRPAGPPPGCPDR